jgi:hypothetical protein
MVFMKAGSARTAATEWVMQHTSKEDGFQGAYFSGSIVGMACDAELSASSDVDIVVVTALDEPPLKLGKFFYRGRSLLMEAVNLFDLAITTKQSSGL